MTADDLGISALERIEAILASPEIHELAAVVPTPPRDRGGRPRHYPAFMIIVYEALISVFGSARQVEAELAHPTMWRWIREACRASTGIELPPIAMRRHHYLYLRNRYLTDPEVLDLLSDAHRKAAATQAQQLGLLRADGAGSWTSPSLDRVVYGDGKVVTPLYRARPGDVRLDRTTGELRRLRAEPDADLHFEGTGEAVWGTKFVILATRGQTTHSRIILDIDFVADKGGEAATAMSCLERTTPHLPGAQAVVYDTALRGVHHQTILRQLGLVPVNRVAAAKASSKKPRRDAKEQRVEKTVFVETRSWRALASLPFVSTSTPVLAASASAPSPPTASSISRHCPASARTATRAGTATAGTTTTGSPTTSAPAPSPCACTPTTTTTHASSTAPRTSARSRPTTQASPNCSDDATTPSRSTEPSRTPSGSDEPTASADADNS